MRVHLVGVSGTGMAALAALFRQAGDEVSGSDVAFDPPMGPLLQTLGVRCMAGYRAANLDPAPDLVVVGNAISRGNPEAEAAERIGIERSSMSAALRRYFLAKRRPLIVAGTHGKTTTSAMCAWLLSRCGAQPGWFIGGIPKGLSVGAHIGLTGVRIARVPERDMRPGVNDERHRGRAPFVVEGDEYDAVYWHKQPKFLDYIGVGPDDVAVVTNIEHDHVDIYPDVTAYEAAFRAFLRGVPSRGLIVCGAQDRRVRALVAEDAHAHIAWYALEHDDTAAVTPTWLGAPSAPTPGGSQTFDLFAGGVACGRFALPVPGLHNVRNAIAAIAACAEGFGLTMQEARTHLAAFEGVRRRQDLLGKPSGVWIYDDFAHHPTAVAETLAALRNRHPAGAMWAVFEPRSATSCRALHQEAYVHAFDLADHVLLAPLGRTNIPKKERLDLDKLARAIGTKAITTSGVEAIVRLIVDAVRPGDVIVVLSNGSFGGIQAKLVAELGRRSPSE